MLLYSNRRGLRISFQLFGSVIPHLMWTFAWLVIYSTLLVFITRREEMKAYISENVLISLRNAYAPQAFGVICAFSVCFRANIAWGRYWEAVDSITEMFGHWREVYCLLLAFIEHSIVEQKDNYETVARLCAFKRQITHWFSILASLCTEELVNGDINFVEIHYDDLPWKSCILLREQVRGLQYDQPRQLPPFHPLPLLDSYNSRAAESLNEISRNTVQPLRKSVPTLRSVGVVKRTSQPGTAGAFWSNSEERQRQDFLAIWKCSARLEKLSRDVPWTLSCSKNTVPYKFLIAGDITSEEMRFLSSSHNPALLTYQWIVEVVTRTQPKISIPPPIYSRVYQELNLGHVCFQKASKLSHIPFPFVFTQLLTWMVFVVCVFGPVFAVMLSFNEDDLPNYSAVILSLLMGLPIVGLNEMSKELENPFGDDVNDLPLLNDCEEFVESLINLYHGEYPSEMDINHSMVQTALLRENRRTEVKEDGSSHDFGNINENMTQISLGLQSSEKKASEQDAGTSQSITISQEVRARATENATASKPTKRATNIPDQGHRFLSTPRGDPRASLQAPPRGIDGASPRLHGKTSPEEEASILE